MSKRKTALYKAVCVYCRSRVPSYIKKVWMGNGGKQTLLSKSEHFFEWDEFDEERWDERVVQCP